MPARPEQEASVLKTGLSHGAMSLACLGAIGLAAFGVVEIVGDEKAGSPSIDVNLFTERPGALPVLKTRLSDDTTADHHSGPAAYPPKGHDSDTDAHHEPSLGVAAPGYPAAHKSANSPPDAHGADDLPRVRMLHDEQPEDAGIKVTHVNVEEQLGHSDKIMSVKEEARVPLAKAPIAGFHERGPVGELPKIADDGRTPAQVYARPHIATDKPKISLIVGGLGLKYSLTMQAIQELPPEVTLSFVPYSNRLQTYVNAAREAGHEVLIELPMEPYDYPNVDTGPETLLTSASEEENTRRLNILLGKTTGYFGVINYQGAKLASDSRALLPILETLSERGLAFIYDGSAPRSVIPSIAESTNSQFVEADRVVDTRPTPEAIDRNLLHLEALALQNGHALGVGFAYPVTVDQFKQWSETLEERGYELSPASQAAGITAAR